LKMIDEMVALLGKEQVDDNAKKAFCESELDKTEDEMKGLEQSLADLNKAIDNAKEGIATLASEIAALIAGVKALDKSVQEATEVRKAENVECKATTAANSAALELIGMAKNRMMKFYNPNLYVAPKKQELSAEQRIAVNLGSEAAPTTTPSGVAGTGITYLQEVTPVFAQVSSHTASDDAPPPPPETWDAYQKKGQEQSGVVAMMDLLAADLNKELSEMGVDEKNAQSEYEVFMGDSQAKRAQDSKSIADKEGTKAELEARLQKMGAEHKSTLGEAYATATTIKDLHLECDWLLSAFQARKEARAGEVDSLKNAKAVLSGADYSMLQQGRIRSKQLRGAFDA
jgi:septal ring factor EnvC (AmiA/AmiB activator)